MNWPKLFKKKKRGRNSRTTSATRADVWLFKAHSSVELVISDIKSTATLAKFLRSSGFSSSHRNRTKCCKINKTWADRKSSTFKSFRQYWDIYIIECTCMKFVESKFQIPYMGKCHTFFAEFNHKKYWSKEPWSFSNRFWCFVVKYFMPI